MATINATSDRNTVNGALLLTWTPLGNADDGAPVALPYSASITVQALGTFGSATVTVEGSNDGTNWFTLTKAGGTTAMTFTAAGGATANEMPAFLRARTSGGTGTGVTVIAAIHARFDRVAY